MLPLEVIATMRILKLSFIASIFSEWVFSDTNSITFTVRNDVNQEACFYSETNHLNFVKYHLNMEQTSAQTISCPPPYGGQVQGDKVLMARTHEGGHRPYGGT